MVADLTSSKLATKFLGRSVALATVGSASLVGAGLDVSVAAGLAVSVAAGTDALPRR